MPWVFPFTAFITSEIAGWEAPVSLLDSEFPKGSNTPSWAARRIKPPSKYFFVNESHMTNCFQAVMPSTFLMVLETLALSALPSDRA